MDTSLIVSPLKSYLKAKFIWLFISMVSLLIIFPFALEREILIDIIFSLILISSIYAVSTKRVLWIIALCIVIPDLVLTWSSQLAMVKNAGFLGLTPRQLFQINSLWRTAFLSFTAVNILISIMKTPRVSVDTLFGSFCVYFLMALVWAQTYSLLESVSPGSFLIHNPSPMLAHQPGHPRYYIPDFLYYSFVTLTTLGYGDIIPLNLHAKIFAVFEAVFGQLYLAVLVARLVGLHIGSSHRKSS